MRAIIFSLLLISCLQLSSQELMTVDYTFKIKNLPSTEKVQFAYYLMGKTYIRKEFDATADGVIHYQADSIHRGVYLLNFKEKNAFFEILINEPKFTISVDYNQLFTTTQTADSKENKPFFEFLQYIGDQSQLSDSLQKNSTLSEEQKSEQLQQVDSQIVAKRQEYIDRNPGTLLADLLNAAKDPQIPQPPAGLSDSEIQTFQLNYYKKHFFDDLNFKSDGLLYSSLLFNKVDFYMNQLTYQEPDSMFTSAERIIELSSENKEMQKMLIIELFNRFAKSKVICMEKAYVQMADKYYLSGKASWIEKEQLDKIAGNVNSLRNSVCGEQAYNFRLYDNSGALVSLNSIAAQWIILIFLKSDCRNCEIELEGLKDLDLPSVDYKIVTVHQKGDEGWQGQLAKYSDEHWISLIDKNGLTDWENEYNLTSYPIIYLLDENKVIKYRRIGASQIQQVLGND